MGHRIQSKQIRPPLAQHAKICQLLEDSGLSLKAILAMQCLLVRRPDGG